MVMILTPFRYDRPKHVPNWNAIVFCHAFVTHAFNHLGESSLCPMSLGTRLGSVLGPEVSAKSFAMPMFHFLFFVGGSTVIIGGSVVVIVVTVGVPGGVGGFCSIAAAKAFVNSVMVI